MTLTKSRTVLVVFLVFLFLAVFAWGIRLQFMADKQTVWNYLFNTAFSLLYFFAGFTGILGGIKIGTKISMGKALFFIGSAWTSYAIGLVVWTYYNLALHVEIPSPSLADFFFIIIFLPLASIGFWNLFKMYSSVITRRHIIDAVGIFILSLIFVFGYANRPSISKEFSLLANLTNAAYPLVDTILLSYALIIIRVGGGKIQRGMLIFSFGLLLQVIVDFIYTYTVAHDLYWNGGIADTLYSVSSFVIGLGLIHLYFNFIEIQQAEKQNIN